MNKRLVIMTLLLAVLATAGCRKHDSEPSNRISVAAREFSPAPVIAGSSSSPLNISVTTNRPEELAQEPQYNGQQQWYGNMVLGNKERPRFFFVLDLQEDNSFALYFDRNNNRDLTDDGPPLLNKGSGSGGPGGFACELRIPWETLILDSPFDGDFEIWFSSNQAGWEQGHRLSHYSRTQLKGSVEVGGQRYAAVLADRGYNDADLTNDGIVLDLNGNGKFDREERASTMHTINGIEYEFDVAW
jgi:hypothetical protein